MKRFHRPLGAAPSGLARSARTFHGAPAGFTLIELLMALVVISLLIAIAIPLFGGVRDKVYEGVVRNDFRRAWESIERYYVAALTYPPTAQAADFTPSKGVTFHEWSVQSFNGRPGMRLGAHHVSSPYEFYNSGFPMNTEIQKRDLPETLMSHRFLRPAAPLYAMSLQFTRRP